MIDDLPLRWIVTGLFVLSGAGFAVAVNRRSVASVLSHGLHLVMAVAMAAMAWPQGLRLPTTVPEILFLAAALWFVMTALLTARVVKQRVVGGYNALTMLAMVWMYAVVPGHGLTDALGAGQHHHHHHPQAPDMDLSGMEVQPDDTWPAWIDLGNWAWTAIFVVAAVVWVYRFVTQRRTGRRRRAGAWRKSLNTAVQAMMALGMAIMFAITLLLA
ncbi:DUF5134 domain-containing protein [Mycobacterium kubicae]|nr:DUF5134 domain-containing protein [Mycobacterium kubicae]MCV7093768.1 DUF5134 domain-containing protein [Mycobacterium kubicae]ORW00749.1 hypothetical protein AWC13_08115 [Mycobacterium kubicae]QNI10080.1 DUF5134 domain-containing protein [Mycobacterium kubicae]QPI38282.1 DUF5134 domain-containing protein [Mycobacterium kubicae]